MKLIMRSFITSTVERGDSDYRPNPPQHLVCIPADWTYSVQDALVGVWADIIDNTLQYYQFDASMSTIRNDATYFFYLPQCADSNECLISNTCKGVCINSDGGYDCGPYFIPDTMTINITNPDGANYTITNNTYPIILNNTNPTGIYIEVDVNFGTTFDLFFPFITSPLFESPLQTRFDCINYVRGPLTTKSIISNGISRSQSPFV